MTDEIIAKYRHIAGLPDGLFAFTFPLRRRAISKLMLKPEIASWMWAAGLVQISRFWSRPSVHQDR
jgi:hypothetical protein